MYITISTDCKSLMCFCSQLLLFDMAIQISTSALFSFDPLSCKRYKYTYMEEMLGNVAGCRQVFERWMEWEPDEQAWHSYINFELRYKEVDKARTIYERYILSLGFSCVVL